MRGVDPPGTGIYLAALRATVFLVPIAAVMSTALAYIAFGEIGAYATFAGVLATTVGAIVAASTWLAVAFFFRHHTTADSSNRRNYNLLREKLDRLENRVKHIHLEESTGSRGEHENGIAEITRNKIYNQARNECEEIEKRLGSKGMPWVTGMGYIELWHRVHRAEEALIKVEPCSEALAWAMHDLSRLKNSNMTNKDSLLKRLELAIVMLDDSGTDEYLEEQSEPPVDKKPHRTPAKRAKALTILSEVRYEINNFRDSVWEGIVHARNRLTDTSVILGLAAWVLLGLAVLVSKDHTMIVWASAYFMVGAIAGLFSRAQAEWTTDTAVDDFGLSTARLINTPWLSGLAAVGGVLITSVLDTQFMSGSAGGSGLAQIFVSKPSLLLVAAVFGATPDLLIRRFAQEAERYKGDLQSTETSQSTKTN